VELAHLREYVDEIEAAPLESLMRAASAPVRAVLEKSLTQSELTREDGLALYAAEGDDLRALIKCADLARARACGDEVTYVVNRNINFTNICFVGCQFCGFKRQRWEDDAYDHSLETILAKAADALARGATELCIQGGINPAMPTFYYRDLLVGIKTRFPQLHLHAFSPMEIMYGARRARMSYIDYITVLKEAGVGSFPGTAAEILDDQVREILSHKKVSVADWVEIITTAHTLGVPTTSTIMYGHIEQAHHVINHLDLIREIQKRTSGFTEFVPLRFVPYQTALYRRGQVSLIPRGIYDLRMYALCRLYLGDRIKNLQTSWVKLGVELATLTLKAGCNDFSGTLMEESITARAGGTEGEFIPVDLIEECARRMGRVAVERTTLYDKLYGKRAPHGARPISTEDSQDCRASGWSRCG
jgi:7,8-didemethyl-8-hydroxy-5-deazariboflavin synthase CofH subunit